MSETRRKPKLLYLVSEDWYFVSHRLPLAVAAKQKGFDVAVATRVGADGGAIMDAGLKLLPIDFLRSGLAPLAEARTLRALIALYRREAPDIVHHVAVKPVVYGSIAARAAGVKAVVNALMGLGYVFSSDAAKARALRPFVRAALWAALKGASTRVIVQNKDDLALFIEEGLARPEQLRLIRGSGVDPSRFSTAEPPQGEPLVVLPARLLRDKGVAEFAAAAQLLKAEGVKARFVLVGDPDPGNPASIPVAQVELWVKDGAVEHWPWQPAAKMPGVFAAAHLVCLPSYREGLPKALLEAAAGARAIVATDVPGCREIVRPGLNGWLVAPGDPLALAAALREAIARPDLRARYGAAGRTLVEREFALGHVIKQTLDVYDELAAAPRDDALGAPPR